MYSKNGTIRNNLAIFNFRKERLNAAKNTLAEHPVLLLQNFVKKSKSQAVLFFRLTLTSFQELICIRKTKVHSLGNFPFQSQSVQIVIVDKDCGLWTGKTVSAHLS